SVEQLTPQKGATMLAHFLHQSRRARPSQRPRPTQCRLKVERLEDRNLLSFRVLATLGDPAPGGAGFRINDFEPNAINNQGDVLYGNDLGTTSDPSSFYGEGVILP